MVDWVYRLGWIEFWFCIFAIPFSIVVMPLILAFILSSLCLLAAYSILLDISSESIKNEQERWATFRKGVAN